MSIRNLVHKIYKIVGTILCNICLLWWKCRDRISPPQSNSVLFVSHPDDDTLFFHSYIKENKPYICLMTTGWSLKRIPCFFRVMKYYGVRYRVYPLEANDPRLELHKKIVRNVLSIGDFKTVLTHNSTGEYGHEEHMRVHRAVVAVLENENQKPVLLCPEPKESIAHYPLQEADIREKEKIFKTMYTTEVWVLDEDTVWVEHENLVRLM